MRNALGQSAGLCEALNRSARALASHRFWQKKKRSIIEQMDQLDVMLGALVKKQEGRDDSDVVVATPDDGPADSCKGLALATVGASAASKCAETCVGAPKALK